MTVQAGPVSPGALALPGLTRLRVGWVLVGLLVMVAAVVAGVVIGPVPLDPFAVVRDLVGLDSGLSDSDRTIIYELRLPRVVLAMLVGATLAISGAAYQGAFGNPLADPYLLGVAAGAGLGATVAIAIGGARPIHIPIYAFVGAIVAVGLTYVVGAAAGRGGSATTLILSGVAVASFMTALQTFVQQRYQETIREVYSWILGRLTTAGWGEVLVLLPYTLLAVTVLLANRWVLDVLVLGDDEAAALGLNPRRTRLIIVVAASLGTAAAVSVSGLIGFVGVIVPHTVRLLAGTGHRVVLPLSLLFGAGFLVVADLIARMLLAPAELPIGVITAFFGAPFFALVLHLSRRHLT
ncbi:MAG: iron ABC transporter permease [Sporichthyaceae bacterium]|nr:iron ABC transporter permease [Sporichthyaceae bacterium]